MSTQKHLRDLQREFPDWEFSQRRKTAHIRLVHKVHGIILGIGSTPSDARAIKNLRARAKRALRAVKGVT